MGLNMKIFIEDFNYYTNLKRTASIVGRPCIWSILSVLMESENNTINITSLIYKLNSNYRTIVKCLNYMKKLQMIEEMTIGRLRLIKLLDNPLTQSMLYVLRELKENAT